MEAVGIVLNIDAGKVAEFERGFREHELPIWEDYAVGESCCTPTSPGWTSRPDPSKGQCNI